jgi:16S rRNA processing protein RimM
VTGESVSIALLGKPRGNRGELTAISLSSTPERFAHLKRVMCGAAEYEVENVWWHQGVLIFKFTGIDSISDAEKLTGSEVHIPAAERVALEPGAYFHSDLIGCKVRDRATGSEIGTVAALQDAGGPGLLELEGGTLIPFASGICVSIDIEKHEILVDLPEGLLELNKP